MMVRFRKSAVAGIAVAVLGVAVAPVAVASGAPVPGGARVSAPVVGPGSEIAVVQERRADGRVLASSCTAGFVAQRPDGRRVVLTAGHCGQRGQQVGVPVPGKSNELVRVGTIAASSNPPTRKVPGGFEMTEDLSAPDWAVIDLVPGVKSSATRGAVRPTRVGDARVGDRVCQQGVTSGWRCGVVKAVSPTQIRTDVKGAPGDSGGPLVRLSDGAALGLVTGGTAPDAGPEVPRVAFYWSLRDALAKGGGLRLVTAGAPAPRVVSAPELKERITVDGAVPAGSF